MEQILDKKFYIKKIVDITSDMTNKKELKIWSDIIERIYEYPEIYFRRTILIDYE